MLSFDNENDNNESNENFININRNSLNQEKNNNKYYSILRKTLKKPLDSKKDKKVDFKKLTKKEEGNSSKTNNNKFKKVNTLKYNKTNIPSIGFDRHDKQQILDLVNNNIKENMYMTGGIMNGNNFIEDFLQNQLKIKRSKTLKNISNK